MKGGTSFTFVTDGIEAAVAQAREVAGDKDVLAAGGGSLAQQCLAAGLLDELQIHVAPLLLGDGIRLFGQLDPVVYLEATRVIESPAVGSAYLAPSTRDAERRRGDSIRSRVRIP